MSWIAGVAAALGVVLAGCGTQTIVKTVTSTGSSSTAASASTSGSTASAQRARVGDTLTITGSGGESVAVTVDQVIDPLPVGPVDQPDSGQRFVGIQLTLKNLGSGAYSDAPSNGATLLSNNNEQAQRQIVTGGPCGNDFQSSVNIAPGDVQQGCIPFELPTGQTPSSFQFTLNSGFADQTAQWSLAGSGGGTSASTSGTTRNPNGGSSGSSETSCGGGLSVGPDTSCPFATNVRSGYETNGAGTQMVYSPTTGKSYSMTCNKNGGQVICTGGNHASAYFPG